jgi:cytoskeletal protein CcmA (bactofilin family)
MEDNQNPNDINSSLEDADTVAQAGTTNDGGAETLDATTAQAGGTPDDEPHQKVKRSISQRVQGLVGKVNIYLMLFVLVILLSAIAAFASYSASKKAANNSNISGQTLSAEDLQNLKNNDTQVGDSKQTLTIASNSIFNGKVLIRDSLDVAGTIHVGGSLSLPGITVSGTSAFENINVSNNLSINGNATIQGTLSVQKNLTVGGGATFAGTISAPSLAIDQLVLNNNLQLNRHIEAGGSTPGISRRGGAGTGGNVDIGGSDTAGSIHIHFGSNPGTGEIAYVSFANRFNQTPHVVLTPAITDLGSLVCGNINYFVIRSTSGFSLGSAGNSPSNIDCYFDYIAID